MLRFRRTPPEDEDPSFCCELGCVLGSAGDAADNRLIRILGRLVYSGRTTGAAFSLIERDPALRWLRWEGEPGRLDDPAWTAGCDEGLEGEGLRWLLPLMIPLVLLPSLSLSRGGYIDIDIEWCC